MVLNYGAGLCQSVPRSKRPNLTCQQQQQKEDLNNGGRASEEEQPDGLKSAAASVTQGKSMKRPGERRGGWAAGRRCARQGETVQARGPGVAAPQERSHETEGEQHRDGKTNTKETHGAALTPEGSVSEPE